MSKKGTMDLTQGRPITQILLFSIPLVIGTLFQQLYSFADTVMVGRLIGEEALAAVGTTYSLNFLTLGFVQGACVGFGIPLAQAVGAKEMREFRPPSYIISAPERCGRQAIPAGLLFSCWFQVF